VGGKIRAGRAEPRERRGACAGSGSAAQ
jgi:hypothetical protein